MGFLVSQNIWIKITKHLYFQAESGKVAINEKQSKEWTQFSKESNSTWRWFLIVLKLLFPSLG